MLFNAIVIGFGLFIAALMALNFGQIIVGLIQQSRAQRQLLRASRAWLALGLAPRNVEEIALLEGRRLDRCITSDTLESFLAPYSSKDGDLDGLATLVRA